jgi:ribosomal protein S12 methylthiotransferase accessory factor
MSMQISFPGGVAVCAQIGSFNILSDQPVAAGGQGSAPSPYELFLASIGTCAGFFALRFCQQRELSTEGLSLSFDWQRDPDTKRLEKITILITLPDGFPEKYRAAIIKATDQCAVKKALLDPPEFAVITL